MEFITRAPIWVWPLLGLLLFVGLRSMREREVPLFVLCALPLLGILAVRSVASIGPAVWVWAVFVVAWGLAVFAGYRFGKTWVLEQVGMRVRVRGERVTLVAVMVLFWANFVAGVLQAVAPEVLGGALGSGVFAIALALASGQFFGRVVYALLGFGRTGSRGAV